MVELLLGKEKVTGRVLGCGPGSMAGLRWLARVGPCPLDAWRAAMDWSEVAARSHARRLEAAGWLAREPMIRGDGCLFWATRAGIREAGVSARPIRRVAPVFWGQHCAEAWVAAWVRLCGSEFLGQREILERPEWAGELRWRDDRGAHEVVLRPNLIAILGDGERIAVQFELTRISSVRRRAELMQHADWIACGQSIQLLYVCADPESRDRIRKEASSVGLSEQEGTVRVELASAIKGQALKMFGESRRAIAE